MTSSYTLFVIPILAKMMSIAAMGLILAAVYCGISALMKGTSPTRGKLLFLSSALLGSGICLGALGMLMVQAGLPILHVEGAITSSTTRTQGKGYYRTDFCVRVASGAEVVLNASGRSLYFRPGQRVKVQYQGYTGSVIKAQFLSAAGTQEGVFNGADFSLYFSLLLGTFFIYGAYKGYQRDPEGDEQERNENNLTALHLS